MPPLRTDFTSFPNESRIPTGGEMNAPAAPIYAPTDADRTTNDRVKVILRVRPPDNNADNRRPSPLQFDNSSPNKLVLNRPDAPVPSTEFTFDRVLPPSATQQDVYTSGVRDVVEDVLQGYNGTVMAYGQTGAGKTYTLGNVEPQAIGMIPRCVAEIFYQASVDPFHTYSVSMSYIQIYMELIQDLLQPQSDNLVIREDASNGVFVAGLQEVPVTSLEECLHYLAIGEQNRTFAFTHLNAHSSRSHAVVMLTVVKRRRYLTPAEKQAEKKAEREGVSTNKVKVGKLYLVDLAGSERLKKSKSVGQRATEARSINLSLTTLGMCISARAMDEKHVPFRDSKLTRLLQESLGGNAKTTLLVNVASVLEHVDETLQSLQFASRAMCVKNKPVVNERVDYRILHAELQSRLDKDGERASHLEMALSRKEEQMDEAMKDALAKEKERFEMLISALRNEGELKVAEVSNELAGVRELAAHEQAHRNDLEQRIKELEADKVEMAEKHYNHVAMLNAQIADLLERQAAEATAHRQEAQAAAAEIEKAAAEAMREKGVNAKLRRQLTEMAAAHRRTLTALAQLQSSLEAIMPGAKPSANCTTHATDTTTARELDQDQGAAQVASFGAAAPSMAATFGSSSLNPLDTSSPALPLPSPANEDPIDCSSSGLSRSSTMAGSTGNAQEGDRGLDWAPQTAEVAVSESLQEAPNGANGSLEAVTGFQASQPSSPAIGALPLSAFNVRSSPAFDVPGKCDSSVGPGRLSGIFEVDHGEEEQGAQDEGNEFGTGRDMDLALKQRLSGLLALADNLGTRVAEAQGCNKAAIRAAQAAAAQQTAQATTLLTRLHATDSELGATKSKLEATCIDLANTQERLHEAQSQGSDLDSQASGLRAQVAELEGHLDAAQEQSKGLSKQVADLEQQTAKLQEELSAERAARSTMEGHLDSTYGTRAELLQAHIEARKRLSAVLTIQRYYRRWRKQAGAQSRAAQIGAGLVMESMSVLRDGLNAIFGTFVARTKEIEASRSLQRRLSTAAPVLGKQPPMLQSATSSVHALGPMGQPRNHAVYAASLHEQLPAARRRAASVGSPSSPSSTVQQQGRHQASPHQALPLPSSGLRQGRQGAQGGLVDARPWPPAKSAPAAAMGSGMLPQQGVQQEVQEMEQPGRQQQQGRQQEGQELEQPERQQQRAPQQVLQQDTREFKQFKH